MALIEGKMIGKAAKGLGNLITGGAINEYQDRRQLRQQKKLQELQIEGSKELGLYNQQLALDTWNKTNYEAQRKHMENAGLNVGLMYGMSGGGGATTSYGGSGSVSGGNAQAEMGMGLQLGIQMQMQKAQIENIEADTQKKKVDAAKTAGVDTEAVKTGIEQMKQMTSNARIQGEIANFEKQLKEIETNIARQTQDDAIKALKANANRMTGEAESAAAKGEIDQKTKDELIKQAHNTTVEQLVRTEALRTGIINTQADTAKTNQQIKNLVEEIDKMEEEQSRMRWQTKNERDRISQENDKVIMQKIMTEFQINDRTKARQLLDAIKAGKDVIFDWK